jgi:Family of unknown function (DUF6194)
MVGTHDEDPDPRSISAYIRETYRDTDVVTSGGGTFFSCDPKRHWPNFATIVTTDEFDAPLDAPSQLRRPGVFRLNIGVSRATFERLVGDEGDPDYAAIDRLLPHPVYARQHWISILNPSAESFERLVKPLLDEAQQRVTAQLQRRRGQASV